MLSVSQVEMFISNVPRCSIKIPFQFHRPVALDFRPARENRVPHELQNGILIKTLKVLICGLQICSICCCSHTAHNTFLYHADKSIVIIMWIITSPAQWTPEWNIRPGFSEHEDRATAWQISHRFFSGKAN